MRRPEAISDWGPIQKRLLYSDEGTYASVIQVLGMFTMNFTPGQTSQHVASEWVKPGGEVYVRIDDQHWEIAFHPGEMRIKK